MTEPAFQEKSRAIESERSAKRIHSLDGLRGLACVAVLLLHTGTMLQPFGAAEFPGGGTWYGLMPGASAVLVFYVLSGVVLSIAPFRLMEQQRDYDWFAYFPRRVVRLCVPLFVAILLGLIAAFAAWKMGSETRAAMAVDFTGGLAVIVHDVLLQFDILFNVSDGWITIFGDPMARVDSPVWSMSWEMWFSLCLPLVIYVVSRIRRLPVAFGVCGLCVFVSYWSGYFPLRLCVMFVFGVMLARKFPQVSGAKISPVLEAIALVATVGIIEVSLVWNPSNEALAALLKTLMSLSCVALVVLAAIDGFVRKLLSIRPCRWLGKISYSMYLTHIILIGGLRAVLPKLGVASPLLHAIISLACCFVFAWVFWHFVERPSIDLSHKVKRAVDSERA